MRLFTPPRTLALALALAACGPSTPAPHDRPSSVPAAGALPAEAPPLGRLPSDVHASRYALDLRIDPARPRFEGESEIEITLDRPRDVIWLHGRDLAVHTVALVPEGAPPITARWEQVSPSGVAAVRLPAAVGPGRFALRIEYDAPVGGNDEGVFVKERGGDRYVFTQFEATYARRAFPGFDEPAFKIPFELSLSVPRGLVAVANTPEILRAPDARDPAWERVAFAPTPPLPSYLLAFAVGPLDVVKGPDIPPGGPRARKLPLRGIATRGRGPELAYALAHTPAIVTALEGWFGTEFPYEKLDLVAVPDLGGAMENAGFITFAEGLLMIDERTAPVEQRWLFTSTTGHEIAHQWFGDLVTMPWWDDIWLNESFATWMEARVVAAVAPELRPEVRELEGVHGAMGADSLVSARKIRQEIADDHDIDSAFDAITYGKGGGVLSMFERWMGPPVFQKGIRGYLAKHKNGLATAGDLLAALGEAAGRDVAGPFRTFLDQPGLPFVEARLACDGAPRLAVKQSRFLPAGSSGAGDTRTWKLPVCARYPDGKEIREACALLEDREGSIPLPGGGCPAWVMPNADGDGYYRWSLAPADHKKLGRAVAKLRERERMSYGDSLQAAFGRATMPAADVLEALAPLAADPSYAVAGAPMSVVSRVGRWLEGGPLHENVERYAASLYAPVLRGLGWEPKKGEDPGRTVLRRTVVAFLVLTARDKDVRKEAAARGRAFLGFGKDGKIHPEAVSPELVGITLRAAAAEGGMPFFEALAAALAAEKREEIREPILMALGSITAPEAAARARQLELSPALHPIEITRILSYQMELPETRDLAWAFFKEHLDEILARLPSEWAGEITVRLGKGFCDRAHRDEVEKLFAPRIEKLEGGPRALASVLEEMSLCVALREAHEPGARAFFEKKKR